ncbi:hypothetical protein J5751_03090 [bacterium]|nr:hypothetical protein [bacterium]
MSEYHLYFADTTNCHFGIKCDAISTQTSKYHHQFHLKSKIIHSILSFFSSEIVLLNNFSVSSHIVEISTYHIVFSQIFKTLLVTDGMSTVSLVTSIFRISVLSQLSLSKVITTKDHAGHLILLTASSKDQSCI